MQGMVKHQNYDMDTLRSVPGMMGVDVNTTAMEIIKATSRGYAELFYPPILGINTRFLAVMRNLWPTLLQVEEKTFIKK